MKWFKHQSTARNDERIARLEDKAGLEGYGFYFKMLEIVAEVIDSSDRHEVTYGVSRWGRQTNISTKKFLFLAQCCHDVGLMSAQRVDDDMIVKIPNLLKFRDNHTKNLQATSKQDKERDVDKEREQEEEKEINKVKPKEKKTSNGFEEFWLVYPNKSAKIKACDVWKKLKPDDQLKQKIIDAVVLFKNHDAQWQKNGGDYEEYSEVDLLIFVNGQIEHIQDTIDLMSQQYQPNQEDVVLIPDATNLNTLKQITLSVMDLRVMFEWFLQNHEIVRTEAYHPEDYEEGSIEPGSKGDKTLN